MALKDLPGDEFEELKRQVEEESARREAEVQAYRKLEAASNLFHAQLSAEVYRGVPVWTPPVPGVTISGYPEGYTVWHEDQAWRNNRQCLEMLEPGDPESSWVPLEELGFELPPERAPEAEPDLSEPKTIFEEISDITGLMIEQVDEGFELLLPEGWERGTGIDELIQLIETAEFHTAYVEGDPVILRISTSLAESFAPIAVQMTEEVTDGRTDAPQVNAEPNEPGEVREITP